MERVGAVWRSVCEDSMEKMGTVNSHISSGCDRTLKQTSCRQLKDTMVTSCPLQCDNRIKAACKRIGTPS